MTEPLPSDDNMWDDPEQEKIAQVAEIATEPAWISEIARKLQKVDEEWARMSWEYAVQEVSKAVQALIDTGEVGITVVEYGDFGGQEIGSPTRQWVTEDTGGGQGEQSQIISSDKWRPYTFVHNTDTPPSSVRQRFRPVVDWDVTLEEKIQVADVLSERYNEMSEDVEYILEDHLNVVITNPDVVHVSDYSDPGIDLYLENFSAGPAGGGKVDHGLAVEISTRWVNPVDSGYIGSKLNKVMDKEKERDVPVDLLVMAPAYTDDVLERYRDSDVVSLRHLPDNPSGNPLIMPDDKQTQEEFTGTPIVGPDYPVIDVQDAGLFTNTAETLRNFHLVNELEYRQRIATIFGQETE